jgi:hypothetical protein
MHKLLWLWLLFLIGGHPEFAQSGFAPRRQEVEKPTLCDLVRHPDQYGGKIVTVSTMLSSSKEGSILYDDACKASPSETDVIADLVFSKGNYSFGSTLDKKLHALLKKEGQARVSIVALFVDARERTFGHLNCCRYRLEVQQLLAVDRVRQTRTDKVQE